jgi:hypothetical protein
MSRRKPSHATCQSGGVATQPDPRRAKDATRAARISKVTEQGDGGA